MSSTGRSMEAHLQVSAPSPGTTSPAASVSTPTQVLASYAYKNASYFYGQIAREKCVTRPKSEISCLSCAAQRNCTGQFCCTRQPETTCWDSRSFFHVVGSFSFRGKCRINTLEGKCKTLFILRVLPAVIQPIHFSWQNAVSHELSGFKEHIVLHKVLKVSMEISKCEMHLVLLKKFSWWPLPVKILDWNHGGKKV